MKRMGTNVALLGLLLPCLWACGDDDPETGGTSGTDPATSSATASSTTSTSTSSTQGGTQGATSDATSTSTSTTTTASSSTNGSSGSTSDPSSTTAETETGDTTSTDACSNGALDPGESDIDCGGACGACPIGSACSDPTDCDTADCDSGSCLGPAENCSLDDVQGNPGGTGWADSYSVDGECYCASTFDHAIGEIEVDTPVGTRTVREICDAIGPGPGMGDNPIYNDIQCGNGPANDAGDEDWCPGRVDQGRDGCCTAGPTWDLSVVP